MTRQDTSRQFDAREEGKGHAATGNRPLAPTHDSSDSPAQRAVPGLLIPTPPPDGTSEPFATPALESNSRGDCNA